MAIVSKTVKRIELPHEPGEWVELRLPLTAGDLAAVNREAGPMQSTLELAARVISGWSYPEPVNKDSLSNLDVPTFRFIDSELTAELQALADSVEKKE